MFESFISSISVGSVYSGSEGKNTSFKVCKAVVAVVKDCNGLSKYVC